MTVNEFLKITRKVKLSGELETRPRVECGDGFSISIQASALHYCTPETSAENTEYTNVELAYPNEPDDAILPFAENFDNPTSSVYTQVPVVLVEELLKKHGGITRIFPMIPTN